MFKKIITSSIILYIYPDIDDQEQYNIFFPVCLKNLAGVETKIYKCAQCAALHIFIYTSGNKGNCRHRYLRVYTRVCICSVFLSLYT